MSEHSGETTLSNLSFQVSLTSQGGKLQINKEGKERWIVETHVVEMHSEKSTDSIAPLHIYIFLFLHILLLDLREPAVLSQESQLGDSWALPWEQSESSEEFGSICSSGTISTAVLLAPW